MFFRDSVLFEMLFILFFHMFVGLCLHQIVDSWLECRPKTYANCANTGHSDTVSTIAFSSDGNLLACGSFDGQINVWNTATQTLQGTLEGSGSGFEVRCFWSVSFMQQLVYAVKPLFSHQKIHPYIMICSGLNGIHEDI
jgi:WD40 repeat protein